MIAMVMDTYQSIIMTVSNHGCELKGVAFQVYAHLLTTIIKMAERNHRYEPKV